MPAAIPTFYPFDAENYQGTGFSFDQIKSWNIPELPPAVMQHRAYERWAYAQWPATRDRPMDVRKRLYRGALYTKRTLATMSTAQADAYFDRTYARGKGIPYDEWPAVPALRDRRRPAQDRKAGNTLSRSRPRLTWRQQVERDLLVLQQLGQVVPGSARPTQLYRTGAGVEKPVPLERRAHLSISCAGCERCL